MSDDEVTIVEVDQEIDKPLMCLLRRLYNHDNKQNTVLTNTQLVNILSKELQIRVNELHDLEMEIYLSIIKKYLKEWPQWDEFDRVIMELKQSNDKEIIDKVLGEKYESLRKYINDIVDSNRPVAKQAVSKLMIKCRQENKAKDDDVIMEINCTREQLNNLIFRQPNEKLKGSIFNIEQSGPSRINVNMFNLETIFKLGYIGISMKLDIYANRLIYRRSPSFQLQHRLVNKKLAISKLIPTPLNRSVQYRVTQKTQLISKKTLINALSVATKKGVKQNRAEGDQNQIELLMQTIMSDLQHLPSKVKVPCSYRRYASQYPYVRYLYANKDYDKSDQVPGKYDLQLEEQLSPIMEFYLSMSNCSKLSEFSFSMNNARTWLKLLCTVCEMQFEGSTEIWQEVMNHFNNCHQYEGDWHCSHCKKPFEFNVLSQNSWNHEC